MAWKARFWKTSSGRKRQFTVHLNWNWRPRSKDRVRYPTGLTSRKGSPRTTCRGDTSTLAAAVSQVSVTPTTSRDLQHRVGRQGQPAKDGGPMNEIIYQPPACCVGPNQTLLPLCMHPSPQDSQVGCHDAGRAAPYPCRREPM